MFILTGETMCPDELKRHSKYTNSNGINRKTAIGNTLCDHIYILIEFNIQYFSLTENIAINTDFNIAIQLNINILTNPTVNIGCTESCLNHNV